MASLFVDTNVFLRFLTNDDPAKAKRAETLFRDALRGKIKLARSASRNSVSARLALAGASLVRKRRNTLVSTKRLAMPDHLLGNSLLHRLANLLKIFRVR